MRVLAVVPLILLVIGVAHSQQKPIVCVWVDGESTMKLHGDSVVAPARSSINNIQKLAVLSLKKIDSIEVVDPCPQAGENIELDVVVGQFRGGYVASVSLVIEHQKGNSHVSSNVIAASSEKLLALDIGWAFESTKLAAVGLVPPN